MKRKKQKAVPDAFLLDTFNRSKCRSEREYWDARRQYEWHYFTELYRQRAEIQSDLIAALSETALAEIELRSWHRAVTARYALDPLNSTGSLRSPPGGRFNVGDSLSHALRPFPALYVADQRVVALAEFFQVQDMLKKGGLSPDELALRPKDGVAIFPIKGRLERVFDLRDPKTLRPFVSALGNVKLPRSIIEQARHLGLAAPTLTTQVRQLYRSLLAKEWRSMGLALGVPSNSQILGELLATGGFQGVLYPSARKSGACLAIFIENLRGEAFVELSCDVPAECHRRRLDEKERRSGL